jgi:hypothetical protein
MNILERPVWVPVVAALAVGLGGCAITGPETGAMSALSSRDAATVQEDARNLDRVVREHVETAGAARKDGYVYAMDVAPLMLYAAQRKDRELYAKLRTVAGKLVIQDTDEPYQKGFVAWRQKAGEKPEVTGAMEQLWMARALWEGAVAFGDPADRKLALEVLDGYSRHAFELQGFWFVRRYYSFDSKTFTNYSVLTGYDPDFLGEVEHAAPSKALHGFSERSYAMLDRSRSPSGLLYPVSEPEIGLAYPGVNGDVFGPRNITPLEDSCYAAEGALHGAPASARRVLDFAEDDRHRGGPLGLYAYYRGEAGAPVGDVPLSTTGYACLMRLAVGLNDARDVKHLAPDFISQLQMTVQLFDQQPTPLYAAGPMLLTAQKMGALAPAKKEADAAAFEKGNAQSE